MSRTRSPDGAAAPRRAPPPSPSASATRAARSSPPARSAPSADSNARCCSAARRPARSPPAPPCDDTVHVVPLEELGLALKTTASTPNFAWVAPNDCTDMEGCGIAAGDAFLKTELTQIMNSPAWRTQRSLAIITVGEDATDAQRPAQRVPTLVVASQGVRPGYTDPARYTHYSLLRTVEAALGLGTLTA